MSDLTDVLDVQADGTFGERPPLAGLYKDSSCGALKGSGGYPAHDCGNAADERGAARQSVELPL